MSTDRRVIDDSPLATIRRVLADNGCDPAQAAEFAALICGEFVGERVYFAARRWNSLDERDDDIRDAARAGIALRALAKEYCISKSQVQRIVADGRVSD